jgi:hypothetical protein
VTIRLINEKCQKIIDNLEAAAFARSLELGVGPSNQYAEEGRADHQQILVNLAQLQQNLDQQRVEILDALPMEHEVTAVSSITAAVEAAVQTEVSEFIAKYSYLIDTGGLHQKHPYSAQ